MAGREDEVRSKDIADSFDFLSYIVGRAKGEYVLGIQSPEEYEVLAVGGLEMDGIHVASLGLDGVEDIDSNIY